jgi:hypothetical protein
MCRDFNKRLKKSFFRARISWCLFKIHSILDKKLLFASVPRSNTTLPAKWKQILFTLKFNTHNRHWTFLKTKSSLTSSNQNLYILRFIIGLFDKTNLRLRLAPLACSILIISISHCREKYRISLFFGNSRESKTDHRHGSIKNGTTGVMILGSRFRTTVFGHSVLEIMR